MKIACVCVCSCVCMTHECRGGWAIWYVWQTIRSCSSSETTESERVYLRGGSQRAFPRSLIRDSDSVEEVRGRGGEGRWRRRRRARTGCIGIWQWRDGDGGKWISGDNQMISIRCYSLKSVWGEGNRRKMVEAHLLAFAILHLYIYTSPFPPPYRPLSPPSPVLFPHRLHLLFPCLIFPLPSSTLLFSFSFVCVWFDGFVSWHCEIFPDAHAQPRDLPAS